MLTNRLAAAQRLPENILKNKDLKEAIMGTFFTLKGRTGYQEVMHAIDVGAQYVGDNPDKIVGGLSVVAEFLFEYYLLNPEDCYLREACEVPSFGQPRLGQGDILADTPAKFIQTQEGFYKFVVNPLAARVGLETVPATFPSAVKKAAGKAALSVTHEGRVEAVVRSDQSGASDSGDGDHRDTRYVSYAEARPLLQKEFGGMAFFKLIIEKYKELTDTWSLTATPEKNEIMAHINEWYTMTHFW